MDTKDIKIPRGGSVYINGEQFCDPTPIEMPLGYQVPESLESMIARMCTDRVMQMELAKQNGGQDTEEEADDFEVSTAEDIDFESSGHQMTDMQEEYVNLDQLRKDSEAHAEREVAQKLESAKQAKAKRKVRKAGKVAEHNEEDGDSSDEGTVNT